MSAFVAYASAGLSYSSGGIGEGLSLGGISLGHIGELGGGLGGGLGGISIGHSLGGGLGGGISLGHIGGLGGGLGISGGGGHYKDIDYHVSFHFQLCRETFDTSILCRLYLITNTSTLYTTLSIMTSTNSKRNVLETK